MNVNVLIGIIGATITCCQMKNIPENACECTTLINRNGFGDCRKGDMNIRICYVVKPSTCPDLIDSVYYDDEQYSEEACQMRVIHETNSKQQTTNRTVFKPNESSMNSGNQSMMHEKTTFLFTMFALCIAPF